MSATAPGRVAAVASVAVVCAISAWIGLHSPEHSQADASAIAIDPDPDTDPDTGPRLAAADLAVATAIAEEQAHRLGGHLDWASVVEASGTVADGNIGVPCTSGRLLRITLAGTFDGVTHGGLPDQGKDEPVVAVDIVADPASEQPCLMSVATSVPDPGPAATMLDVEALG
jgi:hypothetical protein